MSKCPICFSEEGEWTDDPILTTPAPSIVGITYDDYKGFTRMKAQHIKELQDNRIQIETDLGITPLTEFSVIDTDNFYQNIEKYIYELRISTEKILDAVGMTKEKYFNFDKDDVDMRPGNHQLDWTNIPFPTTELRSFQSRAAHIEDLRHYIETYWQETWTDGEVFPLWYKRSNFSVVHPDSVYIDESKNVISDNSWSGNYSFLLSTSYDAGATSSGDTTVNIDLNSLTYDANGIYHGTNIGGYVGFAFQLYMTVPLLIKIKTGTSLSWIGDCTSSISGTGDTINVASVELLILKDGESFPFSIAWRKYAAGSVPTTYSATHSILLSDWSGNDINLYSLLSSLGYDMGVGYHVTQCIFRFENMLNYTSGPEIYNITSQLHVTMDKAKITGRNIY